MRPLRPFALVFGLLPVAAGADDLSDVMTAIVGPEVVVMGEVHDNPRHHAIQRDVAALMSPAAIVYEMFPSTKDEVVNAARAKDAARGELFDLLDWSNSGWPEFSFYAEIMEAAPDAEIYGAERPRDEVRAAFSDGAAEVFGDGSERFGLTSALPDAQLEARIKLQDDAHCGAMPQELLPQMVEAQRLRDAALADSTLRALEKHGPPVLVITGNGHARTDWGVPALLSLARPETSIVSVGQFEAPPEGSVPFDMWLVSPPVERGDPCEAFQKS